MSFKFSSENKKNNPFLVLKEGVEKGIEDDVRMLQDHNIDHKAPEVPCIYYTDKKQYISKNQLKEVMKGEQKGADILDDMAKNLPISLEDHQFLLKMLVKESEAVANYSNVVKPATLSLNEGGN